MKNKKIILIILILIILAIISSIFIYSNLQKDKEFETIAVYIKDIYTDDIDNYIKQFSSINYIKDVELVSKDNFGNHLNNSSLGNKYGSNIKQQIIDLFPEKTNVLSLTIDTKKTDKFIKKFQNKNYIEKIEKTQKIYSDFLKNNSNIQIQAFFNYGTTESEIQKAKDIVSKIDGVVEVQVYTNQEALDELMEKFEDNKDLLESYSGDSNIFPNSLIIKISDSQEVNNIKEQIENLKVDNKSVIDECKSNDASLSLIIKNLDF